MIQAIKKLVDQVKQVIMLTCLHLYNSICPILSLLAPGVVLVIRIELSMVTWEIPSEPNGIITGYEVINYNVTSGDELERSNRLSNTTTEYTIPNLSM